MAQTATIRKISTRGEWIAQDGKAWRVNVPTQNGQQLFNFEKYGGTFKALQAARMFHEKMYNQLLKDRKILAAGGKKPKRETLNMNNKSGHRGVSMTVMPRLEGPPRITYSATWYVRGKMYQKSFSNVEHGTKAEALELAIGYRKRMTRKYRN